MAAISSRVYYLVPTAEGADIMELAWVGSHWVVNGVAPAGTPTSSWQTVFGFAVNGSSRVYYLTPGQPEPSVEELAWVGSNWVFNPIAKNLGAPQAVNFGMGPIWTSLTCFGV